jgi:hypothetical protein
LKLPDPKEARGAVPRSQDSLPWTSELFCPEFYRLLGGELRVRIASHDWSDPILAYSETERMTMALLIQRERCRVNQRGTNRLCHAVLAAPNMTTGRHPGRDCSPILVV